VSVAFPARLERFEAVDSTQRIVRTWLEEGQAEVAVAVAGHQSAGRGRQGRDWLAPPGAGLLLSAGFRPHDLELQHAWRLAATVALAMRDAAEEVAGLRDGTVWLKWPNDLVADGRDGEMLKVGGVLGETVAAGDAVESAVVGIGMNSDWPAELFPAELATAMTSLRELSGGRPISNEALLDAFLARLEPRYLALVTGRFDVGGWSAAQRTTGRRVVVDVDDDTLEGLAMGVDPESGALLVDTGEPGLRAISSGQVTRCRLAPKV
jgi:BirA family transcriptional regulator, biotin operon repressor / biotin---[acetyl-CoA-carboxylase] ligase